jgi:hypothetical protein
MPLTASVRVHPVATSPLTLSALVAIVIAAGILISADGWRYYNTPQRVRAYQPAHRALRPSGQVGEWLGTAGVGMMLFPVAYAVRKRSPRLARFGSMKTWLDVHIFCGTVGPVLITFHTALRFNGLVSVAYWSMVAVVLSGVVGRYLYVRIPRSLRGTELSYAEIEARAAGLLADLAASGLVAEDLRAITPGWGLAARRGRRRVSRRLITRGLDDVTAARAVQLAVERAVLLRRLAQLFRTRRLFALWHVFHLPLVYLMFAIVLVHVGLAIYMGYASFGQ